MIRRPGAADGDFTVLKLLDCAGGSVLIFFNGFAVDQVGYVDEDSVCVNTLTADFFFQRIEEPVDLNRKRLGSRLALTVIRGLFAKLGEILAPHCVGDLDVAKLPEGAVPNQNLDVHLGLAFQAGHALTEGALVGADGVFQGFIVIKNCAKSERKHSPLAEADAHDARVLQNVLFLQVVGGAIKFADYHSEVAARITEDCSAVYALYAVEYEGAAGASSVRKPMFRQTIRVPGHKRSLQSWSEAYLLTSVFETTRLVRTQEERAACTARLDAKCRIQPHLTPGESKNATISLQSASGCPHRGFRPEISF